MEKKMEKWTSNDLYIIENLIKDDQDQKKALELSRTNNLPEMEVSSTQGKFLYLIAKIKNAKRILEIGTFCGYSTIWLAKAVPDDGIVISLEFLDKYAGIARKNIESSDLSGKVKIIEGDATKSLHTMIKADEEPFDMIFIDADKPNYSVYLDLSLRLSKSGTVIYGDNVIRGGELCNAETSDPKVTGVRSFIENLGKLTTLESTVLQTVGIKGYDGFTLSVIK